MYPSPVSSRLSGIRILLIEDNDASRQLMGDYFRYCGYEVLTLADGTTFATTMEQFCPDIILTDLKLRDVDGYELLTQAQQHPEWQKVPIIVISAFAFQADQDRALQLGARQYLVKPIRLPLLQRVIHEELGLPVA